jgi:hypothetical protein
MLGAVNGKRYSRFHLEDVFGAGSPLISHLQLRSQSEITSASHSPPLRRGYHCSLDHTALVIPRYARAAEDGHHHSVRAGQDESLPFAHDAAEVADA